MAIKLSTKGRYGLRLLIDIALHQEGGAVKLRDIAERQEISIKYLWQVINPLKAAGIVAVTRGAHGGFELAHTPDQITLYDIVNTLEGPFALAPCSHASDACHRAADCVARQVWRELDDTMERAMRGITLASIMRRVKDASGASYMI